MAEVGTVMQNLLLGFQVPDANGLRRGDYKEVAKMLIDNGLILQVTSAELECDDPSCHAEAVYTMNELRKSALEAAPCIRGLLREAERGLFSPKHGEMVDCCVTSFQKWSAIIAEACEQFSPELVGYYEQKFN